MLWFYAKGPDAGAEEQEITELRLIGGHSVQRHSAVIDPNM